MKVRNALAAAFVLALGFSFAPAVSAAGRAVEEIPLKNTQPPKHLKRMPDGHWTAWDAPALTDGQNVHVVVAGDTLWDLAAHNINNPYLWPQIWNQNRWVLDSHWIYPGDPITIPALQVVPEPSPAAAAASGQAGMEGVEGEDEEDEEGTEYAAYEEDSGSSGAAPSAPGMPSHIPYATVRDARCAALIQDEPVPEDMRVVGLEESVLLAVGQGDIVYINAGAQNGLAAGDRFSILRNGKRVEHPASHKTLGRRVDMVGELAIVAVTPYGATAEVTFSCENIRRGDALGPLHEMSIPMMSKEMPGKFDVYDPTPSGKPAGYLVLVRDPQYTVAEGNLVDVDLGRSSGVKAGDILTIYRPNPEGEDLPRLNLGLGVVLMTQEHISVVRIGTTAKEMFVGDQVEVR